MYVSVKKLYLTGKGIERVLSIYSMSEVFLHQELNCHLAHIKDYFAGIILTRCLTITLSNSGIITLPKFGPEGEPVQHHSFC